MASNVWELFQPAFRRNRHSIFSVMRKQRILIAARRYKRTTEHLGAEGSTQMMETGHGREDSNRNKLVVTGKLCHYKLTHMVLYCCTGTCTIIALFTVNFAHLHYNKSSMYTRQFRAIL